MYVKKNHCRAGGRIKNLGVPVLKNLDCIEHIVKAPLNLIWEIRGREGERGAVPPPPDQPGSPDPSLNYKIFLPYVSICHPKVRQV